MTPTSQPADSGPDPFEQFKASQGWRERFARKLAHKGADMPDDMDIKIRNGFGWKELAVLTAAGLGAGHFLARPEPAASPVSPPAEVGAAENREYEIIHRDQAGDIIDVRPWPGSEPSP